MPQRTNEFQEIVAIIHKLFDPFNAKITESAMVQANLEGQEREVDILIEYDSGLYHVRIAVEVKDHKRPIDVTVVEGYFGKYNSAGGLVVNKVIIVAHGFTKEARKKAEYFGFELHTLNTLPDRVESSFSASPDEDGHWWVTTGEKGKIVTLSLLGRNGKKLSPSYGNGSIFSRKLGVWLPGPSALASQLLKNGLGMKVDAIFKDHAGEVLDIRVHYKFDDHLVQIKGLKPEWITRMTLSFGGRGLIPDMEAELFALKIHPDSSKQIVVEKGMGSTGPVRIAYDKDKEPRTIRLDGFVKGTKRIDIEL